MYFVDLVCEPLHDLIRLLRIVPALHGSDILLFLLKVLRENFVFLLGLFEILLQSLDFLLMYFHIEVVNFGCGPSHILLL